MLSVVPTSSFSISSGLTCSTKILEGGGALEGDCDPPRPSGGDPDGADIPERTPGDLSGWSKRSSCHDISRWRKTSPSSHGVSVAARNSLDC